MSGSTRSGSGWNASQSRKHAHGVEPAGGDPREVHLDLRVIERDHHRIAVRAGQ